MTVRSTIFASARARLAAGGCRRPILLAARPAVAVTDIQLLARHAGRARLPARQARPGFQRLAARLPHRAGVQGPLHRDHAGGAVRDAAARASGDRAGGRGRDRHHDGGAQRDRSGARADARRARAVQPGRLSAGRSPATTPTPTATCCRSRSTPRRRSSTTTRTSSASPASTPTSRRRPGRRSRRRPRSCAPRAIRAASPPHYPSWVNVENFLACARPAGRHRARTAWTGSTPSSSIDNPLMVKHLAALADWQKSGVFDYAGRTTRGETKFIKRRLRHLHRLVGEPRRLPRPSQVRGRLRPAALLAGGRRRAAATRSSAAAACGCCATARTRNTPASRKFFAFLSRPDVQAKWHQTTGYLPITRAAYELTPQPGLLRQESRRRHRRSSRSPSTRRPTTRAGLRLGSYVTVRDIIEDEMEQALDGKKTAAAALTSAVTRGNAVLREFERTNK